MKMFKDRRGMTGLETAIILVAFVITAAAFSFVVLNMGFLTAQKSQTVIASGMEEASSSIQCDGDLIASCDTVNHIVNSAKFYVRLSEGKSTIDTGNTKMVVTYTNKRGTAVIYNAARSAVAFTCIEGDTDSLIESGERWEVTVNFNTVDGYSEFAGANDGEPAQYESFRMVFKPTVGSALTLERNVPAINNVIQILE